MDKKTMMQVLIPAAAAAGVVLLVGVLIALGEGSGTAASAKSATKAASHGGAPFAIDAPEWKPVDEAKYPGLKYWEVTEGTGTPCPADAHVVMHYTGWLTDGTKFDSSKDRGQPLDMPLGNLVQGWQAGVPGMKPGGVRRLLIPYQLAYGEAGRPPTIPARATLLFEMELQSSK